VKHSADAPMHKPTKRDLFAVRVAMQMPQTWRRACSREDLARHACYVLDADGSRVRSRHFFGEAAGRVIFLSRAEKNHDAHADNGNTPKKACAKVAAKTKPVKKTLVPATSVPLETLVVDHDRCLARTWNAGAGRQCARKPAAGKQFCAQHEKTGTLKHGTVVGTIEPAVQQKYDKAASHKLGAKGFKWYSRVKLWDEARLMGKTTVASLTDDEFQRALYNIDLCFKKHASYIGQWRLREKAGPQSSADRHDPLLLNYLGSPCRYMWFSAKLFKEELAAWQKPGNIVAVEDLSEADFEELLQRTSSRGANHAVVRNYIVQFSGPQCWTQRSDAAVMNIEPRVAGVHVDYRPKDFEWLECGTCERWRRVDLATARLFSNCHWRRHEYEVRKLELRRSFPRLLESLQQMISWDGGSAAARGLSRPSVDSEAVAIFLESVGLHEVLAPKYRRGLLELIVVECRRRDRLCGAVQREVEAFQNEDSGPAFRCDMLSVTTCEDTCDDKQLFARHDLALYCEGADVTVHWSVADDNSMTKIDGTVLCTKTKATLPKTGCCVVPGCLEAWEADRPQGRVFSQKERTRRTVNIVSSLSGLCLHCYNVCRRDATALAKFREQVEEAADVPLGVSEETLVVTTNQKLELHFRRGSDVAEWIMMQQPYRITVVPDATARVDYRHLCEDGRLPSGPCSITSEDFAPLRTAKIHVALRQEPLQAMQRMQDIMCHLIRFECRECRIRFPAFHPDYAPDFEPNHEAVPE